MESEDLFWYAVESSVDGSIFLGVSIRSWSAFGKIRKIFSSGAYHIRILVTIMVMKLYSPHLKKSDCCGVESGSQVFQPRYFSKWFPITANFFLKYFLHQTISSRSTKYTNIKLKHLKIIKCFNRHVSLIMKKWKRLLWLEETVQQRSFPRRF